MPVSVSPKLIVNSDARAFKLLSMWLESNELPEVEFVNWPKLRIVVEGAEYHSSLSATQLAALIDIRTVLGRAYAAVAHGTYDMRRLRQEEEQELEFTTSFREGSSISETDLSPVIHAFSTAIQSHQALALVSAALIGLTIVSAPIIKRYLSVRSKQIDLEDRQLTINLAQTALEIAQARDFDRAQAKVSRRIPQLAKALPDASDALLRFAGASVDADRVNLSGIEIPQHDLEILASRREHRRRDVRQHEDSFSILGINKVGTKWHVTLKSATFQCVAEYRRPWMTEAKVKRLSAMMLENCGIRALIEIKSVENAQTGANLIRFSPIPATTNDQ